jgi:hypothetical protein
LAYDNERIQVLISELYDFTPVSGRVCINKMPARIQTLLRERPELLDLIKKEDPEAGKYWCFPPLDPLNYRSSLENYQLFPDPKEYMVGFTCSKKKHINILNTTTSYISDNSSKTPSPDRKVNLKEPVSYSPTLYNHPDEEYRAAPVEVRSPKAAKKPILRSVHAASPTRKESPKPSTAHKTYESIEASIRRIRGALQKSVGPETHTTRSQSPRNVDRNYLSPTAASIMKHRDKTPQSPRGSISGRPPSQIQERVVGNRKNLTLKLDNLMKKARRVSPSTESPRPPLSSRGMQLI